MIRILNDIIARFNNIPFQNGKSFENVVPRYSQRLNAVILYFAFYHQEYIG